MKTRIFLGMIILVLLVLGIFLLSFILNTRNAPLELDNQVIQAEEAVLGESEEIPYGNPPRDLMILSNEAGDWDIWMLKADGSRINLTGDDTGAVDLFASVSLDGESINFLSNRLDAADLGPSQVNPDGSELRNLTILAAVMTLVRESKFDWDLQWSPDGNQFAWISLRDLNLELYSMSTEGEINFDNALRRTNRGARDWYPAWSPDARMIAYNSDADGDENIYLFNLETNENQQVTTNPEDELHPMWGEDSSRLFFVSEKANELASGTIDIFSSNLDGTEQRALGEEIMRLDFVYAPNASHLAFMSNETGSWQVYVMQADGTNLRRVSNGEGDAMFPVWLP